MQKSDVSMNAVTYGHYNKAVLESKWPTSTEVTAAKSRWTKVSNVLTGIKMFRLAGNRRALRRSRMHSSSVAVSSEEGSMDEPDHSGEETSNR